MISPSVPVTCPLPGVACLLGRTRESRAAGDIQAVTSGAAGAAGRDSRTENWTRPLPWRSGLGGRVRVALRLRPASAGPTRRVEHASRTNLNKVQAGPGKRVIQRANPSLGNPPARPAPGAPLANLNLFINRSVARSFKCHPERPGPHRQESCHWPEHSCTPRI